MLLALLLNVIPLNPVDAAKLPMCPVCPCSQLDCVLPQMPQGCIGQVLACPTPTPVPSS